LRVRALVADVGEPQTKARDLDDLDAGWEDEVDDLDAGWDDEDASEDPEGPGALESKGLTPELREARAARAASKKERMRAKAAEKAERRKARVSAAAAKQKRSAPRPPGARPQKMPASRGGRRDDPGDPEVEERPAAHAVERSRTRARSVSRSRRDWRGAALLGLVLILVGCVALYVWKR
jgi:cobalamin biosynthesis Mg chelatase CobN